MPTFAFVVVLCLAPFFALAGLANSASLPNHGFAIKPYTIQLPDHSWLMNWSYETTKPPQDSATLDLRINNNATSVKASLNSGIFSAHLPLGACDFGQVFYHVAGMADWSEFADVPCPDSQKPTRLTFAADAQEGPEYVNEFARQITHFKSAAIIIGGDLVQTGSSLNDWLQFFEALSPVLSQQLFIPVVGNHEYRYSKDVPYWKLFFKREANEAFYATDVGAAHIIVLNSSFEDDPSLKLKQLPWLEAELKKTARWRIVVYHHPAYSRGFFTSMLSPLREFVTLRRDYLPLFEAYHVDLVLNGHTHLFEHSVKAGIHYVTMGPAGGRMGFYGATNPYSIMAEEKRTVLQVELNQKELRGVTTDITGKVVDDFSLKKNL